MIVYTTWEEIPKSWKRGFESAKSASSFSNIRTHSRKMGASLFSGNKLLSQGANKDQTHPFYLGVSKKGIEFQGWIHAEMNALVKRQYRENSNLIIYVYRENVHGDAMSRPCEKCIELLKQAGVQYMRYITREGHYAEEKV